MPSYFKPFPKISYNFKFDGSRMNIVDIFRCVDIRDRSRLDELVLYLKYRIPDGMRPDVISQLLYGTPNYYWTFFIVNEFLKEGLQAWPLSYQELSQRYAEKYDKYAVFELNHTSEVKNLSRLFNWSDNISIIEEVSKFVVQKNTLAGVHLLKDDSYVTYKLARRNNIQVFCKIHDYISEKNQIWLEKNTIAALELSKQPEFFMSFTEETKPDICIDRGYKEEVCENVILRVSEISNQIFIEFNMLNEHNYEEKEEITVYGAKTLNLKNAQISLNGRQKIYEIIDKKRFSTQFILKEDEYIHENEENFKFSGVINVRNFNGAKGEFKLDFDSIGNANISLTSTFIDERLDSPDKLSIDSEQWTATYTISVEENKNYFIECAVVPRSSTSPLYLPAIIDRFTATETGSITRTAPLPPNTNKGFFRVFEYEVGYESTNMQIELENVGDVKLTWNGVKNIEYTIQGSAFENFENSTQYVLDTSVPTETNLHSHTIFESLQQQKLFFTLNVNTLKEIELLNCGKNYTSAPKVEARDIITNARIPHISIRPLMLDNVFALTHMEKNQKFAISTISNKKWLKDVMFKWVTKHRIDYLKDYLESDSAPNLTFKRVSENPTFIISEGSTFPNFWNGREDLWSISDDGAHFCSIASPSPSPSPSPSLSPSFEYFPENALIQSNIPILSGKAYRISFSLTLDTPSPDVSSTPNEYSNYLRVSFAEHEFSQDFNASKEYSEYVILDENLSNVEFGDLIFMPSDHFCGTIQNVQVNQINMDNIDFENLFLKFKEKYLTEFDLFETENKYSTALAAPHHFKDENTGLEFSTKRSEGNNLASTLRTIDGKFEMNIGLQNITAISNEEYERSENEKKEEILIIDPANIREFANQFTELIQN